MATQEPALPFAIDADITPLQARYFESAQRNIGDPRARMQTYDLIRRSFGGLQAAREAVAAREAQAAERAAADEFNRLRLESGRFDLLAAREKVAREKAQAEQFRNFATSMQEIANDPNRPAEDRYREISGLAATAATAGIDVAPIYRYNTAQIFGKPVREPGEDKPTYTSSDIKGLLSGGRSTKDLIAAGLDPLKVEAAQSQVTAEAAEKQAADLRSFASLKEVQSLRTDYDAKIAGGTSQSFQDETEFSPIVDNLAITLDRAGLLSEKEKVDLYKAGYAPFDEIEGVKRGVWNDKKNQKERAKLVKSLVLKAQTGVPAAAAPRAARGGISGIGR